MMSSNGFGGGATGAAPRVQVRPASGTESGTVVTAQQEVRGDPERQLLPDHGAYVYAGRSGWQRVEVGIVNRFGIAGEDGRVHINVDFLEDLSEATATLAPHHAVDASTPEVFSLPRRLELSANRHVPEEVEPQPLESRVVGVKPAIGLYGTPLQSPNIHSQHSPLK
jgi:hypothetical protein